MNTYTLREEILAQTQDQEEQIELVKAAIMAECPDRPEARLMTSCRMIQAMAGGIRDESGLIDHIRNLEEVKAFAFGSITIETYAFPALNEVRSKYLDQLLLTLSAKKTKFNMVTLGDEIENRIMSGKYDKELLAKILPHLQRIQESRKK